MSSITESVYVILKVELHFCAVRWEIDVDNAVRQ